MENKREAFTGIKTYGRIIMRLSRYLLPHWKATAAIILLSSAGVLLTLVNPFLAKFAIDKAFANRDMKIFIELVLIGGAVFVTNGLARMAQAIVEARTKLKITFDLHRQLFDHLASLSLNYFRDKSQGEHLYPVIFDLERLADYIVTQLPAFGILVFRILLTLGIIVFLNWKMALVALLLTPLLYVVPCIVAKKRIQLWSGIGASYELIVSKMAEFFLRIAVVKAFGKEKREVRQHLHRLHLYIRTLMRNTRFTIIQQFGNDTVMRVVTGIITFLAGYQVVKGEITLGSLSAITLYLNQLIGLHASFMTYFESAGSTAVSFQHLESIMATRPQVVETSGAKHVVLRMGARIEFKAITFGYRVGEPVISRVGFAIEPRTHAALVGASGCGKTTLLNLLLRLYDPWEGDITIDGCNTKEITLRALREQLGVALQESFLWNASIRDNIRYACKDATDEELEWVAKICLVDRFAEALPERYATVIGEGACKISEGQKQKIAIARAILKKPKILILDEAMSSMDAASEEEITRNIKGAFPDLSIISVSHRLSTVMAADAVYFLRAPGEIVVDTPQHMRAHDEGFRNLFADHTDEKEKKAYTTDAAKFV